MSRKTKRTCDTSRPSKPLISCERFNEGLRPCDPAKGPALWKPYLGCRGQAPAAVRVARLSGEDKRRQPLLMVSNGSL